MSGSKGSSPLNLRLDNKRLDVAIKALFVVLILAIAYVAFTLVSVRQAEQSGRVTSRAIENLRQAVEADPQNAALRVTLAEAFAAEGSLKDAFEQYSVALELDPENPNALAGLALLSMFQEDWQVAEEYWTSVIKQLESGQYAAIDQRLEQAYYQMGVTLMQLGRYEDAAEYLRGALRLRRTAADTHYMLAVTYRQLGSELNERAHLEDALTFDPAMPEANYDYGLLLLREGDTAGAAEHFRISADNAPSDRREPMSQLEELGSASDRLEEARRLAPTDPAAALVEARIARALDPDDADTARYVAVLFERAGDEEGAAKAWRRVLELVPNDDEALDAIERLGQTE